MFFAYSQLIIIQKHCLFYFMENRSRIAQAQIRRIVSKYQLGQLLGKGSYSQVFQAHHQEDGKIYAVKVISNRVLAENIKVKEYISNQLAIHNVLQPCLNIVRFIQLLQTKNNCYFVYQYCEGGTLYQLIKKEGTLNQNRGLLIFSQLVEGLKVLRKHNIMHRDLKPENVLIKEGNFKLADFGFCKQLGGQSMTKTMLGSPLYMAPQVLRGQAYSVNADIWSIGVILYEMLYGHCPFQSNSIASLISTIDDTYLAFEPSVNISAQTRRFITRCLQKDCKLRIKWDQFFQQVHRLIQRPFSNKSSQQIFIKSLTKINPKQNLSLSGTAESRFDQTSGIKQNQSKSKYEIFKQNYNKLQTKENPIFHNTADNFKSQKTKLSQDRKSDLHLRDKQSKISYSQMVIQHQYCWKLLKILFQKLQLRDIKIYPLVCYILKGLKKVLDNIYSRINLENTEMLPILSIVKYELIQIQKVCGQVEKVIPIQVSNENEIMKLPQCCQLWKKIKQFYT